ncbi:tetratricopeptide repeat protein [Waterburya agarophytonicola K14]|uniref:Tetratricopeptide repeat protein n=1 Tax=Waterburya agarophytonicola KI4 TaxID=2874699 RepID=A0A964BWG2_9CYAN|nr:tetratricopeptide repeat protein [Waterburya agarophytonicola]MCC0178820.1 tetratricopeptide repeat protein [Waterburya agarophytonicola KI4]
MKNNFDRNPNYINSPQPRANFPLSSYSLDLASLSHCYWSNLDPKSSEHSLRSYVQEKASQGEYTIAISILDELIALNPDNAADYNNRGLMHFRNNQMIEALCDLSQALEIDPHLDSAYNNRANCYAAQGDLSSAIADYDLALDLNPANLRAWINQGITFRELGLYDLALENFDITLIIGDALEERIYPERGRTYHLRGDWNCAAGDYQKALDVLANKPELVNHRKKVTRWLNELLSPLMISD